MTLTANVDQKTNTRRSLFASVLGTSLESYDFYLYGTAASLYFTHVFFPNSDPATAAISSFLVFATAFLARPLGAFLFGKLGDTVGRTTTLRYTLLLMGLATAAIGLVPSHNTIGIVATLLLLFLRCLQGTALGGEWGGSILITTENEQNSQSIQPSKRDFYAAIPQIGSAIGTLASVGIFMLLNSMLSQQQMLDFGWRIPFLLALPFTAFSMYIRLKVAETQEFQQVQAKSFEPNIFKKLFTEHTREMVIAIAVSLLPIGSYFLLTTYTMNYGVNVLKLSENNLLTASFIGSALQLFTIPFFGSLASRYGSQRIMLWGSILTFAVALPLYWIMKSATLGTMIFCMILGGIFPTLCWAVLGGYMHHLFGVKIRYSALSIAYAIAAVITGFIPAITAWFGEVTSNAWWHPAVVLMLMSFIGIVGCLAAQKSTPVSELD
ncbi:MAG: MFS transporter [Micrococcaceae bacterium]